MQERRATAEVRCLGAQPLTLLLGDVDDRRVGVGESQVCGVH